MAFDSYSSNNQENQTSRKQNATSNNLRQRSASNLRAPLSNVSAGRRSVNDTTRTSSARHGDPSQTETKGRNGSHTSRKPGEDDYAEHYDDIPENMYRPDKEDLAGWIHREKLAKIENEELQAAGIHLAKARSKSKDMTSGRVRDRSRDQRDHRAASREDKRQRISSPVNEDSEEITQETDWDPRTPEEIAGDEAASQIYNTPGLRRSGSKIPVMTSSPTPIPSERYERETPMPRKRTLSGSIAPEDTLSAVKGKLNQDQDPQTPSSKVDSPIRQRNPSLGNIRGTPTPSETKTTPGQKKPSAQTPPNAYNNNINNPVTTRTNETDRPRTATNAPEGDPPWLATMYKPDPLLPPDQQLIPTLAKKQAQQMWEANGSIPSAYDRNFDAIQIYGANGLPQREVPQQEPAELEDPNTSWPLKPIPPPKPTTTTSTSRPATSSGTGGYSTMPKVSAPPITVGSSRVESSSPISSRANTPVGQIVQQHSTTTGPSRLQQQPLTNEQDEKLQKKGCCCIVM